MSCTDKVGVHETLYPHASDAFDPSTRQIAQGTRQTMPATLKSLKTPPGALFWSAPLGLDSDFTAEDPLALDYLGQQVGLWLFQGFKSRTGSVQNYSVVLYRE